jgi:aspartyl-tRNA(Asn)/glutamyl-tRNA(Gln) amidotransferase subunit B
VDSFVSALAALIKERGWEQINDPAVIAKAVGEVWQAEADTVADARAALESGNEKKLKALSAYLVGKTLAATGGRASPEIAGVQVEARLRGATEWDVYAD